MAFRRYCNSPIPRQVVLVWPARADVFAVCCISILTLPSYSSGSASAPSRAGSVGGSNGGPAGLYSSVGSGEGTRTGFSGDMTLLSRTAACTRDERPLHIRQTDSSKILNYTMYAPVGSVDSSFTALLRGGHPPVREAKEGQTLKVGEKGNVGIFWGDRLRGGSGWEVEPAVPVETSANERSGIEGGVARRPSSDRVRCVASITHSHAHTHTHTHTHTHLEKLSIPLGLRWNSHYLFTFVPYGEVPQD